MRFFNTTKTEPETPAKSEAIQQKLKETAEQIEAAEGELQRISLEAALSGDEDAGHDVIARLHQLRGRQELLRHALVAAEQIEADERDELKLVEHKARKRSASQHAGALERAAKEVTRAQTALIEAYNRMVQAAGSLVAVVPAHMRSSEEPWQSILSEGEIKRMVKVEGYRLNRQAGAEFFSRTGTNAGAAEATTDGYTIPTLSERVAQLTARLKEHFDNAPPVQTQATTTGQGKQEPASSGGPSDVGGKEAAAPASLPPAIPPPVDRALGLVDLRGSDLGVPKEVNPQPTWQDFPVMPVDRKVVTNV